MTISVSAHLRDCDELDRTGRTPFGWTDQQAADYLAARAKQRRESRSEYDANEALANASLFKYPATTSLNRIAWPPLHVRKDCADDTRR